MISMQHRMNSSRNHVRLCLWALISAITLVAPLSAKARVYDIIENDDVDFDFSTKRGLRLRFEDPKIALRIGGRFHYDFVTAEGRVEIDIKPGSEFNSINLSSSGVIPVAILSSPVFDATEVNPATVSLAGASIKLVGKSGKMLAHLEDANDDGLDDLVCQVLTERLLIEPGASLAVLQAETYSGLPIEGQDTMHIVSD